VEALTLVFILLALPTQYGNLGFALGVQISCRWGMGGTGYGWQEEDGREERGRRRREWRGEKEGERGDWRGGRKETSWRFIGLPGAPLDL
jgi:hypothetical protein